MAALDPDTPVGRAVEAFNDHDLDALMAEMADGHTFVDPLVPSGVSGEKLRAYTADVFAGFPDVRLDVDRVFEDADGSVALEGSYSGTHEGPIEGVPATGHAVAIPTVTVITVTDDGITAWRDYWNEQAFAEQLGLTFPAILPKLPGIVAGKIQDVV